MTLSGSGFTGATSVRFDGIAGTAFAVMSDTEVRVTTPAHAAGVVDVTIIAPSGSNTLAQGFGYGNVPSSADAPASPFNTPLTVPSPASSKTTTATAPARWLPPWSPTSPVAV